MIMAIYYLKTTNEGKTYALSELKNNLMSEREDFKKRMAQKAAKDDRESGRKSQLQRSRNANGSQIRRGSYDKIISSRRPSLSFQPSLAPSVGGNYKWVFFYFFDFQLFYLEVTNRKAVHQIELIKHLNTIYPMRVLVEDNMDRTKVDGHLVRKEVEADHSVRIDLLEQTDSHRDTIRAG